MAGSEQDTTGSFSLADKMAGSWGTEDAVLSDQELLDTICSTDLCNCLNDLRVVVATVTANNEERTLNAFGNGEEDAGDEGLGVVGLLEDDDLLAKTRTVMVNK